MSFLNLSLGELLGLVGAVSAGVVALYLLDRSKRRQLVSTLRFWTFADVRTELKHRRRIQQPWSLALQLVSLALLLAAIAGPQWGVIDGAGRDHVLIVDTSAWMGSLNARQGILMDDARAAARAYLRSLPARDRLMLVRADALATPATAFESNRQVLENAIRQSQPGSSALNLEQAVAFAQRAQRLQAEKPGEIAFIGAGRVAEQEAAFTALPRNFRVVSIGGRPDNIGLRKIGLRRSPSSPDTWDIYVAVRNYGSQPRTIDLGLQFAKSPAGSKRMNLKPGAEEQAEFSYKEKAGGWLEARVNVKDAFAGDDRAIIELPSQTAMRAIVYSSQPELLRPLFGANGQVETVFRSPAQYVADAKADLVVIDGFAPSPPPRANSLWIEPPSDASPIPVKTRRNGVKLERWRVDSPLGEGLRTKDVVLESAELFSPAGGDMIVAEASDGPLIVARGTDRKTVVLGFHPGRASMKYELATPLLVANILRWMTPGTFRRWELQAGTPGTVNVPVEKKTSPSQVRVVDEKNRALPFTIDEGNLRFFSGAPGTVRVQLGDREMVYSLTLPDIAEAAWQVPAGVRKGVPRSLGESAADIEIWPWLAVLGGLGLLADWLLFGRSRAFRLRAANMVAPFATRAAAAWRSQWRKAS